MKAVIPVAGQGKRLEPLTYDKPKCLITINGKTILEGLLQKMRSSVSKVVLIVSEKDNQIREQIGDKKYGIDIDYVYQEKPLGVAHAVLQAKKKINQHFLLVMGDNYFTNSFRDYIEEWKRSDSDGGILVQKKREDSGNGIWVKEGEITHTKKVYEREPKYEGCGLTILPQEIFQAIKSIDKGEKGEYEIEDAINVLLEQGFTFIPLELKGSRININDHSDLRKAREMVG